MTNRIELNWTVDGVLDEQRYYCSETPIDVDNLPVPKVVLAGDVRSYVDTDTQMIVGKKYYIRIGAVKFGIEKISNQFSMIYGDVWTPSNLSSPAKLWMSADSVIVNGSNLISQANDISGNNYHFIQPIDGLKPKLIVDSIINKPVFKFDGIDDYMNNPTANNISKNTSYLWSLAIHKKEEDLVGTNTILRYVVGSSPYSAGRFAHYASTGSRSMVGVGTRRLDTDSITGHYDTVEKGVSWVISLAYHDYNQAKTHAVVDGVDYILETAGSTGLTSNTSPVGAYAWFGSERAEVGFFKGSVAEIISGNTQLTQIEIDKLIGWVAHKYGLQSNLPVDHPYKELHPTK